MTELQGTELIELCTQILTILKVLAGLSFVFLGCAFFGFFRWGRFTSGGSD
jgi:hypothetical protein